MDRAEIENTFVSIFVCACDVWFKTQDSRFELLDFPLTNTF